MFTYVVEIAFCSVAVMATRMFSFSRAASAARFSADLSSSPDMFTVFIVSTSDFLAQSNVACLLTELVRADGSGVDITTKLVVALDLEVLEKGSHLLLVGDGSLGLEGVESCQLDAAGGLHNVVRSCKKSVLYR